MAATAQARTPARRPRGRRVPIGELRERDLEYHRERGSVNATLWLHRNIFRTLEGPVGVEWVDQLEAPEIIPKAEAAIPSRNLYTRRAWMSGFRGILKRAVGWGLMHSVPTFPDYAVVASYRLPKGRHSPAPSRRAVGRLFEELAKDRTWEGRRIHALVAIIALAGIGLRQALRLEVEDFDLKRGTIRIRGGRARRGPRGSRAIRIRIDRRLRPILAAWLPETGCQWAFPGKQRVGPWRERSPGGRRGPFSPDDFLQAAARVARIKVSFEGLRRSFEKDAVSSLPGADVPTTWPKSVTSPPPPPAVELDADGESAWFRGVREELTGSEFRAVKLLVDRYPGDYDLKGMTRAYGGKTGWRELLRRLKGRGEHVDSSVLFPADRRRNGGHGGFGIAPR